MAKRSSDFWPKVTVTFGQKSLFLLAKSDPGSHGARSAGIPGNTREYTGTPGIHGTGYPTLPGSEDPSTKETDPARRIRLLASTDPSPSSTDPSTSSDSGGPSLLLRQKPDPATEEPDPATPRSRIRPTRRLPPAHSRHSKSLTSSPAWAGLDLDPIQHLPRIGLGRSG